MKHKERGRNGGKLAAVGLFFALLACVAVAGSAFWQGAEIDRLVEAGSPVRLMERLEEKSRGVGDAVRGRMNWLGGVAERLAAQPDEESLRALLPEVEKEWDASMQLCLLDDTGEGFSADGTPVSLAGEAVVQNAVNSPDQQGMDFQVIPSLGEQRAVVTAVSFTDAMGAARVLLAAGGGEVFTLNAAEGDNLLLVSQHGDVLARSNRELIPETANLLGFLSQPGVRGTAVGALYQAFLDGEPGVSWHSIEAGWVCLLYAPIEGTNWMAVLAQPGNLADAGAMGKLPGMIVPIAGGLAILFALLLCAVLLRGAGRKRRTLEDVHDTDETGRSEDMPEAPAKASEDIFMQS